MNRRVIILFALVLFISQIACQESIIPLQGLKKLQISTDIPGSAIALGTSKELETGSVLIQTVDPTGGIITVTSKVTGDTLEITISEDLIVNGEDSTVDEVGVSDSTSTSSKVETQFSSFFVTLLLVGVSSFFLPRFRWIAITLTVLIYCTAKVTSSGPFSHHQIDITIIFSQAERIDALQVISSGSMLAAPELYYTVSNLQCGSSSSDLKECTPMICYVNQETDCYSRLYNNTLPIGILISNTGDFELISASFNEAISIAIDRYGAQYPRIQFISDDTQSSSSVAVEKAKEMYNNGIRNFIGPFVSEEAIEVLKWSETQKEKVIFISPTVSSNKFASYKNFISLSPNNNVTGAAFCSYFDYQYSHALDELLIIHVDDDYGRDLTQSILLSCTQMKYAVTVVSSYAPNSIQSEEDAIEQIIKLENAIKSNQQAALFISYGEIKYFVECAGQNQLATKVNWFGSNFGLSASLISSPLLLDTARTVQLRSIQFSGTELDITDVTRRAFFRELYYRGDLESPLAVFPYDAVLLYYFTTRGEKLNTDILLNRIRSIGENTYGLSGWLKFNPDGFREKGEYHSYYIPTDPTLLDITWDQDLVIVFEKIDLPAWPYRLDYLPVTGRWINSESFQGCEYYDMSVLFETANSRGGFLYLDFEQLQEGLSDGKSFMIPTFTNVTIWNTCDATSGITFCAANDFASSTTCYGSKSDNKKRDIATPTNPEAAFESSESLTLRPTDNMFTSAVGATGTVEAENAIRKPMNFTNVFP